jgi:hypothetical protein
MRTLKRSFVTEADSAGLMNPVFNVELGDTAKLLCIVSHQGKLPRQGMSGNPVVIAADRCA